jgi:hypothetical protein
MRLSFITLFVATIIIDWLDNVEAQQFCSVNVGGSCDSSVDHPCCTDNAHAVSCQNEKWIEYVCQIKCLIIDGTSVECDI